MSRRLSQRIAASKVSGVFTDFNQGINPLFSYQPLYTFDNSQPSSPYQPATLSPHDLTAPAVEVAVTAAAPAPQPIVDQPPSAAAYKPRTRTKKTSSQRKRSQRSQKADHIKRPTNCFFAFRACWCEAVKARAGNLTKYARKLGEIYVARLNRSEISDDDEKLMKLNALAEVESEKYFPANLRLAKAAEHADGRVLSQLAASQWRPMPAHERTDFKTLFDNDVMKHKALYPDYKYAPGHRSSPRSNRKTPAKKNRRTPALVNDTTDGSEQPADSVLQYFVSSPLSSTSSSPLPSTSSDSVLSSPSSGSISGLDFAYTNDMASYDAQGGALLLDIPEGNLQYPPSPPNIVYDLGLEYQPSITPSISDAFENYPYYGFNDNFAPQLPYY